MAWDASSDNVGVTAYRTYISGNYFGDVTTPSKTYNGLLCGTVYTVSIEAVDAAGNRSPRVYLDAATSSCGAATAIASTDSPARRRGRQLPGDQV